MSRPIDIKLAQLMSQKHNLREHLGLLKGLSTLSDTAVEFGFRTGASACALCAGGAKVISYDLREWPEAKRLRAMVGDRFEFRKGDTRKVVIPECDLLFIDTWHVEALLYEELTRHHGKVRKWIAMHDTETFGEKGEDKGDSLGLNFAISRFLIENREWFKIFALKNNNGLTLLGRVDLYGDVRRQGSSTEPPA